MAKLIKRCAHHAPKLGYLQAHFDADERIANGEEQIQCPLCKLYLWPHELGVAPTSNTESR